MSEREPAMLRDDGGGPAPDPAPAPAPEAPSPPPAAPETPAPRGRREAASVYVVGFWKRLGAATIDAAVIVPAALLVTLIVGRLAGLHLPRLHVFDVDMWIDLVLATDPALLMALVLFLAIAVAYLLVFQIVLGRTLGMRVLKLKIIDVYGDPPSPRRCVARCAGYVASLATLFLGFLWIGFDSEKRGLQDWIAGTYVIRA
jgi:uncharacterized RDD family membrane protein YckC